MDMEILELINNGEYSKAYEEAERLFENGDFDEAYVIADEIYEDVCEKKGRNSTEAYERLLSLADLCYEGSRYEEALGHYNTAIRFVKENNYTLESFTEVATRIARIYTFYGEYEKAVQVLNELLTYSLDKYGDNSSQVVNALNTLAQTYYRSGDYKEALEYFGQVNQLADNIEGCGYERVFSTQSIGRIYDDMGQAEKAFEVFQEAYHLAVEEFGEENRDTLSILNDISGVYLTVGDLDKALEIKKKLLETQIRVYGENNHDTQMAKLNLGHLYQDLGDYDKALELKKSSCEWFESVLGEEHESTLLALKNLKNVYACLDEKDKELEICERLCQICENTRGKYHIDTLEAYSSLAVAYMSIHNTSAGADCAELAYNRALEKYGEVSPESCSMLQAYIIMCFEQGEYEQVSMLCRRYLDISQKLDINDLYDLENVYNLLASADSRLGRNNEAEEAAEKCLETGFIIAGNRYTPFYLNDMNDMAFVYADLGEGEKALEMMEIVLKEKKERNITYPNNYVWKDTYAHVLITLCRYDDAEKTLKDCIAECGEEILLVYRMAELYHAKGDNTAALEYAEHASELAKKKLDSDSREYKDILNIITTIKEDMQ